MNKMILPMALAGSLAGCGQKEEAPGPATEPVPSIVGTWTQTSSRTQVDYASSTPDTDVTTSTPPGVKLTFDADGKLTSEMPPSPTNPSGVQTGSYQLAKTVLITTFYGVSYTNAVEALTSRRLVTRYVESDASSTSTRTYTFAR